MRALVLAATAVAALVTAVAVQPASGQADLPNTGGAFEDDNGDYHEAAINAIAADGITKGCAEDRYCPSLSVTRAQMASFLARAYRLGTRAGEVFDDVTPGSTHSGAIAAIEEEGITEGCTPRLFCPDEPVTHAPDGQLSRSRRGTGRSPGTSVRRREPREHPCPCDSRHRRRRDHPGLHRHVLLSRGPGDPRPDGQLSRQGARPRFDLPHNQPQRAVPRKLRCRPDPLHRDRALPGGEDLRGARGRRPRSPLPDGRALDIHLRLNPFRPDGGRRDPRPERTHC